MMGYYTSYTLGVEVNRYAPTVRGLTVAGVDKEAVIADLRDHNSDAEGAINEDGSTRESAKWYEAESHIAEFSQNYPALLFILDGLGEDGERFRIYAANGETQRVTPQMMYPPFDPHWLAAPAA